MKILIDRRTSNTDEGGIPEPMNLDFSDNLELKFQIKMQKFADLSPTDAYRQRKIQVVQARESLANNNNILVKKLNTNFD